MHSTKRAVAWLCLLSTFLTGCYSSVLVKPDGDEKAKMYSNDIKYVITWDGKKYHFDKAPAIVNEAIVGEAKQEVTGGILRTHVSIPISEVAEVSVMAKNEGRTAVVILACIAGCLVLLALSALSHSTLGGG